MAKSITAANAKFTLVVPGLGLTPHTLQGYAADAAFAFEDTTVAETQMGVDGKMSAGFVPAIVPQRITLQADSNSKSFFDAWLGGQKLIKEIAYASAVLDIAAIGQSFIMTKGALKVIKQAPDGQKVLQPITYGIDWEDIQAVPLAGLT